MNDILANTSIFEGIMIIVMWYLLLGVCIAYSSKILSNIFLSLIFLVLILVTNISVGVLIIRLHNLNVLHLNLLN